jgi:hypothetical protein
MAEYKAPGSGGVPAVFPQHLGWVLSPPQVLCELGGLIVLMLTSGQHKSAPMWPAQFLCPPCRSLRLTRTRSTAGK